MLEIAAHVELWQIILASPLALAGSLGAFIVRRRPARIGTVLLAFAVVSALVGGTFIYVARATDTPAIELREVLIAGKFAVVFGLMLLLGASGLAPRRVRPPA